MSHHSIDDSKQSSANIRFFVISLDTYFLMCCIKLDELLILY